MINMPLASFVVLTYNQASFVRASVESVLNQNYTPLEIIISDDSSTDGTHEIAAEIVKNYKGPHSVIVRRTKQNLGITKHLQEAWSLTKGELILIGGGDDESLPERTRLTVEKWLEKNKFPDLVLANLIDMDQSGECHGVIELDNVEKYKKIEQWVESPPYIIGASCAWSRRLIKKYPTLPEGLMHEDQLGIVRAILEQGGVNINLPLVKYRRGGVSSQTEYSSGSALKKRIMQDASNDYLLFSEILENAKEKMPEKERKKLQKLVNRASYIKELDVLSISQAIAKSVFDTKCDIGFRLRALVQLRTPAMIAKIKTIKTAYRQSSRK